MFCGDWKMKQDGQSMAWRKEIKTSVSRVGRVG